jgi:hypothetical protein
MQGLRRLVLYPIAAIAVVSAQAALADQQIGNVVQRHYNGAMGLRAASAGADDLIFDRDVFAGETVKTPGSASTGGNAGSIPAEDANKINMLIKTTEANSPAYGKNTAKLPMKLIG